MHGHTEILRDIFGYKEFRANQEEIIVSLLQGQDTLAVLPTGAGKSLCFSLPAAVKHREKKQTAVVVSPLISLMSEQTVKLRSLGLAVRRLGVGGREDEETLREMERGEVALVFCSPEKLVNCMEIFARLYQIDRLSFFAIDEIHCVTEWGSDFRPDYKRLVAVKQSFPTLPILGLSATLTAAMTKAIEAALLPESSHFAVFAASMNRPNLKIEVRPKISVYEFVKFLQSLGDGAGIVYCHTQDDCNKIGNLMETSGLSCVVYHAGIGNREQNQLLWTSNKKQWAIATVALGMGIDKADTRHIIHWGMPLSLERYMQEIGRAGRDGNPARCVLFWESKDETSLSFALKSDAAFESIRLVREFCLLRRPACRRQALLGHFGEAFDKSDCNGTCDLCTEPETSSSALKKELAWFEELVVQTVRANPAFFTVSKLRDAALGLKPLPQASALNHTLRTSDKVTVERVIEKMIIQGVLVEDAKRASRSAGFSLFFKTLTVAEENLPCSTTQVGGKRPLSDLSYE